MNSLKDKLLKAGLVTEEAAERAESEKRAAARRRRDAAQGGGGPRKGKHGGRSRTRPAEERLSPEELAAAEARRAERERQQVLNREREENRRRAAEERARAEDIRRVAEHLGLDVTGEVVFHFTNRKNKLQRLRLTPDAIARLESGELAIVEHPLPHAIEFAVVPREGAEAVLKIEPRAVRFYYRGEGERYGFAE
jgi:uncharacterized protein